MSSAYSDISEALDYDTAEMALSEGAGLEEVLRIAARDTRRVTVPEIPAIKRGRYCFIGRLP